MKMKMYVLIGNEWLWALNNSGEAGTHHQSNRSIQAGQRPAVVTEQSCQKQKAIAGLFPQFQVKKKRKKNHLKYSTL